MKIKEEIERAIDFLRIFFPSVVLYNTKLDFLARMVTKHYVEKARNNEEI